MLPNCFSTAVQFKLGELNSFVSSRIQCQIMGTRSNSSGDLFHCSTSSSQVPLLINYLNPCQCDTSAIRQTIYECFLLFFSLHQPRISLAASWKKIRLGASPANRRSDTPGERPALDAVHKLMRLSSKKKE